MLSRNEILANIFSALAPCSPLMFSGIHFDIIGTAWRINQDNFIGIFLATISTILWIISYFGLHNLTSDPEYPEADFDLEPKNENEQKSVKLWTTKDILKDPYIMLLFSTDVFSMFQYFQLDIVINLTAVQYFHLTLTQLVIIVNIVLGASSVILMVVQKKLMNNALNIFFLYLYNLYNQCYCLQQTQPLFETARHCNT